MKTVRPIPSDFSVVIEYPKPGGRVIHSRGIRLFLVDDDDKETLITSCGALTVHADTYGIAWAEAELWADEKGKPIFTGQPVQNGSQLITKIFNCNVREIRSKSSFSAGYRDAYEYLTGKTAPLRLPLKHKKVANA